MLKTFAPSASTPPSWNTNAWMNRIAVITMEAAAGPSVIANKALPNKCPLVPTPTGKFTICAAKTNAPITPSNGSRDSSVSRCARRAIQPTAGTLTRFSDAQTGVDRYPSGICMNERGLSTGLYSPLRMDTHARILGLGTDLCEVDRLRQSLERFGARFTARVFTAAEVAYCEAKANQAERYAARFAAKEAGMKALGTGWTGAIRWHDFEVVNEAGGRPRLRLHGAAAEHAARLGARHVHLSLTHARTMALAVVILEA